MTDYLGDMVMKRFQYWGRKDGKPCILWTDYFPWNSDIKDPIQHKGFKGNNLLNEYREN